jgi:hypothetical protein
MKEEMGGVCSTNNGNKKCNFLVGKLNGTDELGDLNVYRRIILKWTLKIDCECVTESQDRV